MVNLASIARSMQSAGWALFKSLWRSLLGVGRALLKHRVKLLVAIIVALTIFATLPPAGSILILHRSKENMADADRQMRRALAEANARNFAANHVRMLLDEDFVPRSDLTEKFGIDRIQDVLDASISAERAEGFLRGSLGVNFTAVIQSYVDGYFSTPSTILIVDDYVEHVREDLSSERSIVITANRVATREIRGDNATEVEFTGRIANFLLAFFFDRAVDCERNFCARHFPSRVPEIERVSKIISALTEGKILGVCDGLDDEIKCIAKVRSELESLGEGFLVRDILLLLVEFANLKEAISRSREAVEIGDTLDRIHRQLIKVKGIRQFSEISRSEEALQHFLRSVGAADLELNQDFLSTAEFYQIGRLAVQAGEPLKAIENFKKVKSPPSWFQGYLSGVTLVQSFDPENQEIETSLSFIEEVLASDFDAEYIKKGLAGILYRKLIESRRDDFDPSSLENIKLEVVSIWSDAVAQTSSQADRLGAQIEKARSLHALAGAQEERLEHLLVELQSDERGEEFRNAYMSAAMFASILGWANETRELLEYAFKLYPRNICAYSEQPEFISFRNNMGEKHDEWISKQREMYDPPC